MKSRKSAAWVAWLVAALYYFYQYSLRSAPAVMMPQLSAALGLSTVGVASLVGLFYYGYAPFSLVAGSAIDRLGPRAVVPAGALVTGLGALLFGTCDPHMAQLGRILQGSGGVFALVGAVFIAGQNFPSSRAATLIGATQMFGMSGGAAGQILVGPVIAAGVPWNRFWIGMGVAGVVIAAALYWALPRPETSPRRDPWIKATIATTGAVFRNPQSILCGLFAGCLFIPTTLFDMIWGVRFLQEAHGMEYGEAVLRSTMVPLGWIIGCPLLGFVSDRLGRRRPVMIGGACVLLACLAWILYGPTDVLPPYVIGLLAGISSGAAMLAYTVIKEANPPEFGGTATGVVSFLNLTSSALLGPVFGSIMRNVSGAQPAELQHYQTTFQPLLYGVALAIVLAFLLKETGPAVRVRMRLVETV